MIDCFEKETAPLTEYEEQTLLPIMVKCLNRHKGKEQAISNRRMMEGLESSGYVVGGSARIRKLINHIRINGLVDCLMASNSGYYITEDPWEMQRYIESLQGREDAICAVKEAMQEQLMRMNEQ